MNEISSLKCGSQDIESAVNLYNLGVKEGIKAGEKKAKIKILLWICTALSFINAGFAVARLIQGIREYLKEDEMEEEEEAEE